MKRRSFTALLLSLGLLAACQTTGPNYPAGTSALRVQTQTQAQDRYLCSVASRDNQHSVLKVMELKTSTIRSLFVPGRIVNMEGVAKTGKLYVSSKEGSQNSLFEVDVKRLSIQRVASFNQAGIKPKDFLMSGNQVLVSGYRNQVGNLMSYDLQNKGWSPVVFNLEPGNLDWGTTANEIHSVIFDEENIVRTSVDIKVKRITNIQKFQHGVPFGNNIGLASPHGFYFYALHQLQGQVEIYAFDIDRAAVNRLVATTKAVGILYSSVLSRDGRHLYATIDNQVHRFELQGTQMKRLPPIQLPAKEARYITLSPTNNTLYISHDGNNSISKVEIQPDQSYQVTELPYPGPNNELIVF